MVSLTFYGGVSTIGGNTILLQDQKDSIMLDFGLDFKIWHNYYGEFLYPRKFSSIASLRKRELIPDILGIYREDYLRHIGEEIHPAPDIEFVYSHPHLDHCQMMHWLNLGFKHHMSEAMQWILETLQDAGTGSFNEFTYLIPSYGIQPKLRHSGYTRMKSKPKPRDIRNFKSEEPFYIGCTKVVPYKVDHSIPGANSFIINTSMGPVIYTGDLRISGWAKKDTKKFIIAAKMACEKADLEGKISVLISEGTGIDNSENITEQIIYQDALELTKKTRGLVIVEFPQRNLDRLLTFYKVAKKSKRTLVVDARHAHILNKFSRDYGYPKAHYKNMGVFLSKKNQGFISWDFPEQVSNPDELRSKDYFMWEREFIKHPNRISVEQLRNQPHKFIFFQPFFAINDLDDISYPNRLPEDSIFIRSLTEPFDDRTKLQENMRINWINLHRLPIYQLHVSGHLTQSQLEKMITTINPSFVIPVHTEHPEIFQQIIPQMLHGFGTQLIIPEKAQPIIFS